MILYHGSNVVVSEPRLLPPFRFLDFGPGFYTTTNKAQAIGFSDKVVKRQGDGERTVCIYELDEQAASLDCRLLRFEKPDEEWLDFVSANRTGKYSGEQYDLIFGPVANDDVYTTFALYTAGVLSRQQTIEALKIKKLFDQYVFASEKALSYLRFIGTLPSEEII